MNLRSPLTALGLWAWLALPASAGIVSGTIEKVSPQEGLLVVKTSAKTYEFTVESGTPITFDSKKSTLAGLKVGSQVSVITGSNDDVKRISARTPSARPAVKPKPKPRPTPKTDPTPSKSAANGANDWNQFGGPNRDNISPDSGLLKQWPAGGPQQVWVKTGLGEAYSSVAVTGGMVITMGNQGDEEAILAMDLATGNLIWKASNGRAYQEGRGNGPRGTPTVVDGKVYALGGHGQLSCVDLKTGQVQWTKNILQEFGGSNITWGISESPLVDGNNVIVTPGGPQATMVALNKETGQLVWRSAIPQAGKAGYSSAIAIEVGRVRQYVQFTEKGLIGVRANDGQFLWANTEAANGTANCSSPVFFANHVFYASGYNTGGALVQLASQNNMTAARKVYFTKDMKNHHGGMVVVDGYLYGSNDPGILTCIDLKTGNVAWQDRSIGKGAVIYADGHIILRSEEGPVALIEANPKQYVEKGRFDQPQRSNKPSWPHPVVADGKLFLRDMDTLLVYDLKQ